MASIIPNDGANYILNLIKTNNANLYIGLGTALPADGATLASGSNEIGTPGSAPSGGTGTYNRFVVPQANVTVTGDTLSVSGLTIEFTGFTNVSAINAAFLTTTSGAGGKLVCATTLTTGNRILANTADKLTLTTVTFQLT